ncbi:MAG TPA: hypothetical protein VEA63_01130 [Opitutus sp.]|nr:hypothetical protein [Opitutus sp.]
MTDENTQRRQVPIFVRLVRDDTLGIHSGFSAGRDPLELARRPRKQKDPDENPKPEEEGAKNAASRFDDAVASFSEDMLAFLVAADRHFALDRMVSAIEVEAGLKPKLEAAGRKIKERPGYTLYAIAEEHLHIVDRAAIAFHTARVFTRFMPKMLLAALIARYDAFLAQLIEALFYSKPEMARGLASKISFEEILDLGSIEDARRFMVEREAENVLRNSHDEQLKWFEEVTKLKTRKHITNYAAFIELCERRNLLVHTDGRVSSTYLNNLARHGIPSDELKVGDQLHVSRQYYGDAVAKLIEVGTKLALSCWEKFAPGEREKLESRLIHLTFELIVHRHYKLAVNVLAYVLDNKKTWADDDNRLICLMNYANAMKLSGDSEEAARILSTDDWSTKDRLFRVCVAAVRDDVEECVLQMKALGVSKQLTASAYKFWPVFKNVKEDARFVSAVKDIYGDDALLLQNQEVLSEEKS